MPFSRAIPTACLTVLTLFAGCGQGTSAIEATDSEAVPGGVGPQAGLPDPPRCASHVTATLEDGMIIRFDGGTPGRPDVCLASWQGKPHEYYLGFWGDGRAFNGTPEEREAVLRALTGPVGTETEFAASGARLWKGVTVTHVANPILIVDGQPRPTVELRQVMHDAHDRPDVRAEFLHWVDQATGISLRRQTRTQMADGQVVQDTTWQVRSLQSPPS